MNILIRYFLKEFFKYFIIIILTFTAISIVAEFFDKASEFYTSKPSVILIVQYLLLQTPRVILYALPFASMFSILITIGIASRWRETVIIKAAGSSTKKIFSCFLVLGGIITILAFFLDCCSGRYKQGIMDKKGRDIEGVSTNYSQHPGPVA
jgi:lipopolysaccharide export LptBFGC system permease protein LptF